MKIVYIGAGDGLAETLAERMGQEGNDVYLLSDKALSRKSGGVSRHRFYRAPRKGESFGELLRSVSPDLVIFAGNHYISSIHEEESDEDVTLLARSLRSAATFPRVKFVLLSSTEVYGNTREKADESAECAAVSERGIRFIREEGLLDIYRKQHGMDAVILRASQLYTNRPKEGGGDILSRSFSAATAGVSNPASNRVFQPLHVSDFVDAIKRVMDAGKEYVYNVCGSTEVSAKRLYQLACLSEKCKEQDVRWEDPVSVTLADSSRVRQELGWSDFRNLEEQLQKGEITYERASAKGRDKKKRVVPAGIRQLVENLLIFAVFFCLNSLCSSHSLFSRIDWLMIYVILISISYNIYQSALAAVLASAAYLYGQNMNILEFTTFYTYAGSVLAVMEFVFLGLIVSYTTNMLREEARSVRLDLEMLKKEYEDLRAVNKENVLIKNEYEERLLTTKSGFPKLYNLVSRLMVQEPDRILMETMQVISELVCTDTVAVYQGKAGSPWLRLVGALSDSATMDGKTWNLSGSPRIYDAVARGELYQGEFGSGEPAVVLPIVCRDVPVAVVLIKTLPYESETLYHINLLKTMSLLLRDSMEKALQYEELSREERYVKDTDVLKPEAFRKRILLAEEKADKCVAEYCVVELVYSGSLAEAAASASQTLRVTDCLGTDGEGKLFALLAGTGSGNLGHLQKRLLTYGMEARLVSDESAGA
ncbi:MAG: NAD(P)-dependent oxidoreductase [Lachnospiraceae bacterium]|nr:NAD(P)-dependent oxidoreductase [Lachnospiraceae bacterium]